MKKKSSAQYYVQQWQHPCLQDVETKQPITAAQQTIVQQTTAQQTTAQQRAQTVQQQQRQVMPDNAETASGDAIANLIASTDGTVDIQLWCSELEAYQNVMKELTDKFKEQYSDVDFNITIGAVSEADAKDKILEDIDAAADVFVFADDQVNDLVNAVRFRKWQLLIHMIRKKQTQRQLQQQLPKTENFTLIR